jgi:hypothetical protein
MFVSYHCRSSFTTSRRTFTASEGRGQGEVGDETAVAADEYGVHYLDEVVGVDETASQVSVVRPHF